MQKGKKTSTSLGTVKQERCGKPSLSPPVGSSVNPAFLRRSKILTGFYNDGIYLAAQINN